MFAISMFVLFALAAILIPRSIVARVPGVLGKAAAGLAGLVCVLIALGAMLSTSIVSVPADKVGLVRKIYGFKSLPDGHIIAADGQNGYQADVLAPGTFMISPFFNVINEVTQSPLVTIPSGFYGRIVANDGEPLADGQIMADAWPEKDFDKFFDAKYFLKNKGRRGLQLSVLRPGIYPLNLALFQVKIGFTPNGKDVTSGDDAVYDITGFRHEKTPLDTSITKIPTGSVGVVRSTVQDSSQDCHPQVAKTDGDGGLVAEVVPRGCKGVWNTSISPGDYILNKDAFDITMVSTRVTTIEFKGGYNRRHIDLKVDAKGDFTQTETQEAVPIPPSAASDAVNVKTEGWEVPQELRVVVQITPEHAPVVVASVGGQQQVDDRIVIPSIRSNVRNVFGGSIVATEVGDDGKVVTHERPIKVLDAINQRPAIEEAILKRTQVDGRRAGVDVLEIRLGEPAIPPELLLARQRQQLAGQLLQAYEQERLSQTERQKAEQARATAEQQPDLVRAQIAVQTADLGRQKRLLEGEGEQAYLKAVAAGQKAQADVLGQDGTIMLQVFQRTLDLLTAHPEILSSVKLPDVLVTGGSGGLEGPAGIFGHYLQAMKPLPPRGPALTQANPTP